MADESNRIAHREDKGTTNDFPRTFEEVVSRRIEADLAAEQLSSVSSDAKPFYLLSAERHTLSELA